jgi:hypothetical protein
VDADPLGLDPGQRLVSDMHTMFEVILGNPHYRPGALAPGRRPSSSDDPYRWDRLGGKVRISHGIHSRWRWCHQACPKYMPEGAPADFAGGAPDWRTAWAYARRHMLNFHGVELGAAGWPTDGSA